MHAAGAQSNPRVAPFGSAFFGALRPGALWVDARVRAAWRAATQSSAKASFHDDRLETGDLVRIRETGAQVFVGFRVLLGRGINRREGNRRMLHW